MTSTSVFDVLKNVDWVPPAVPPPTGAGKIIIFEDNEAVIKMILKGRSPTMRHILRTQRVDIDWLFERVREDPGVFIKYVGTKEQIADILTKGSFSFQQWKQLCDLIQIRPHSGAGQADGFKQQSQHRATDSTTCD